MDDSRIIALLWQRDERALMEFTASHKLMCLYAANEITGNIHDAEECWSDTCLAVWNSIPPQNLDSLRAYALKICKNFALNHVKAKNRQKRSAILVELDECISDSLPDMEVPEIGALIDTFMETLPKREAVIFVRRYNCSQPVKDIAAAMGMTENQVSKILQKLRRKLKKTSRKGGHPGMKQNMTSEKLYEGIGYMDDKWMKLLDEPVTAKEKKRKTADLSVMS